MTRLVRFCEMVGWVFWLSLVPTTVLVQILNVMFMVAVFACLLTVPTGWEAYRDRMPRVYL